MKKRRSDVWAPVVFIGPAFIIFTVFLIVPTFLSFYMSLTSWNGISTDMKFIGLFNYKRLLDDEVFFKALRNTVVFTVATVILQNGIGLLLAEFLDRKLAGGSLFKALYYIPSLLSTVVVGTVFMYVFNPYFGTFNLVLKALGMGELSKLNFLGAPKLVLGVIIVVNVWQWFGYSMMIYLGGLQGVDQELTEAAVIDGANQWNTFWKVKFPMIASSVTVNVLLTVIGSLKTFDLVYVMTGGGPNHASETVGTLLYSTAFKSQEYGYGTAMSVVLFIFIALVGLVIQYGLTKREVSA